MNIVDILQEECGPFTQYNNTNFTHLFNGVGHVLVYSDTYIETFGKDMRVFIFDGCGWIEQL